jgi:hypothetical protein
MDETAKAKVDHILVPWQRKWQRKGGETTANMAGTWWF